MSVELIYPECLHLRLLKSHAAFKSWSGFSSDSEAVSDEPKYAPDTSSMYINVNMDWVNGNFWSGVSDSVVKDF